MKIDKLDENNIVVYLKETKIEFDNKDLLENYFINLFSKLRDFYNISIQGYYNIKIYVDEFYGTVLEILKEDIEYFDYFDNSVDMRASIPIKTEFLYEIEDYYWISKSLFHKIEIYTDNNHIYLKIIKSISNIELGIILENSKIIYKDFNKLKLVKM